MYLGSSGEHDQVIDVMRLEALARGELPPEKSPQHLVTRVIHNLISTLIVLLVVGSAVWLAGGEQTAVVMALALSLGALVLFAVWSKHRSRAHVLRPDENR